MIPRHTSITAQSAVFTVFGICTLLLAGCASAPKTPARLYDLDNGRVVKLELYHLHNGRGRVTGVMPDGRVLEGKFALNSAPPPTAGDNNTAGKAGQNATDTTWAVKYGYTQASQQRPVGSGSVSGKAGYTLRFVLYSIDTAAGYGTGLARDSNGTWYRLYAGRKN